MNDLFFDNRIAGLILKFLQEDISEAEYQELQAWAGSSDRAREIFDELTSEEKLPVELAQYAGVRERVLAKIHAAEPETRTVVQMNSGFRWKPWLAAAVVVGLAITGYFLLIDKKVDEPVVVKVDAVTNDVAPGKDGAILKLANGDSIIIDDLKDGEVVKLGDISVVKEGGRLIYKGSQSGSSDLGYNTTTTPKGRTYRVELADGSVAWLNAASSLYYPVVFGKDERRVELTGEAYFEVTRDISRKFVVVGPDGTTTEVLGTSFDINTYQDEPSVKVTLLEGSIRVNKEKSSVILKPGQQASVSGQSQSIPVKNADVGQVMAWKNGEFKFQSTPMEEMMRQISRWYDVEVVYEGDIKADPVSGTMKREWTASQTLDVLKWMGYKFRIEGKKITVTP